MERSRLRTPQKPSQGWGEKPRSALGQKSNNLESGLQHGARADGGVLWANAIAVGVDRGYRTSYGTLFDHAVVLPVSKSSEKISTSRGSEQHRNPSW